MGNDTPDDKYTPSMGATIQGHMEIVKFLLTQPGLDPQKPSSYFSYDRIHELELGKKLGDYDACKAPIDQAIYDGNRELVQILLADIRCMTCLRVIVQDWENSAALRTFIVQSFAETYDGKNCP